MKTIAIIGDIHGCLTELEMLYKKIRRHTDEIYSVGDLIDRGINSKGVVNFCMENDIMPVMGNHEYMMINSVLEEPDERYFTDSDIFRMWMLNGGDKTIGQYCEKSGINIHEFVKEITDCGHLEYIKSLPLRIETDTCIITHGGIVAGAPEMKAMFNRSVPSKLEKLQVFGHTPVFRAEYRRGHYINIDTGCIYGGKLSAAIVYPDSACEVIT